MPLSLARPPVDRAPHRGGERSDMDMDLAVLGGVGLGLGVSLVVAMVAVVPGRGWRGRVCITGGAVGSASTAAQ